MIYCRNCGVELEDGLERCPLCNEIVNNGTVGYPDASSTVKRQHYLNATKEMTEPQKKIIWEIVSITILSIVVVVFFIDLILSKNITWSQYPVAISLIGFSYISSFAFLKKGASIKIIISMVGSSACLLLIDSFTGDISWSVSLAIPLLLMGNLVAGLFLLVIAKSKYKGINLISYGLVAVACYCLGIDAILSLYKTGSVQLYWSVIVIVCVLPVAAVLLFVHYRLTKTQGLERIFHL